MARKKLVFQSNAPFLKSGLAENGRLLMNWLARRGKYDLVYYCQQVGQNDPNLSRLPYKAYGAAPADPSWQQRCGGDFGRIRDVMYGGHFIHDIIKAEKPDIWVGSDDAWSFPGHYYQSEWFKRINSVLHITVDSIPVTPQAYEQAKATPYFLSWAKFAVDEMRQREPKTCGNVDYIYGASDVNKFRPATESERLELRRAAGLDPKDTIFLYVGRNQLRKELLVVLKAFAEFKKLHPNSRAKLLFHTDWKETQAGWNLPQHRDYHGLKVDDVLATYLCRNCRHWEVKGYTGEDLDCRFCGAKKSQVTVNGFTEGVEDDEMWQIYGLADAGINAITSGGLEYHGLQTLLSGLPLACTNYSCGADFCEQPFVYPIKWHTRHEVQSSFIKAANDIYSIRDFMVKVYQMKQDERRAWGVQGREWAAATFSVDTIGAKWEKLFDSMPPKDWSQITLEYVPKKVDTPMPQIADDKAWIKALYNGILLVEPDPKGMQDWLDSLKAGVTREAIYRFFIERGKDDNAKNAPPQDFWSLIDRTTGRKRAIWICKESIGDCIMMTQLFESFHAENPDHDLYVATDPKHNEVFAGNDLVFRVLSYHPAMESEMAMIGAGRGDEPYFHVYHHAAIGTQRLLQYINPGQFAYDLNA